MEKELMDTNIKNITINAQNSGTLGRLILGLLINSPFKIKLIGDKVFQKEILKEFQILCQNLEQNLVFIKKYLPLTIVGSKN